MRTLCNGAFFAFVLCGAGMVCAGDKQAGAKELNDAYAEYQKLAAEQKWQESLPHAKRAYELGVELLGDKEETVVLAFDYGANLKNVRDYQGAVAIFESTLAMGEKVYGKDSIELTPILTNLGLIVYHTPKKDNYKS
jgi:hypothetical protein